METLTRCSAVASLLAAAAFMSVASAGAATFNLSQTFDDPTVTSADNFGWSVALDGNYVLIGAVVDDTNGSDVGQAHLFDAATGSLLRTFNDPTPTSTDRFGFSVAIDGNNLLIGTLDDTHGTDVGQAHLFDATTGTLLQTFDDPTVTAADLFGNSVAINGNNVLIGARYDDTNGINIGQTHLFDATTGGLLRTFNDPTPTSQDAFGWSIAIDGNNVLIGAPEDDTNGLNVGQTHLFDATTGSLLRTFNDPTPTTSGGFGLSVAIDGNYVLIGAPFDDTNGTGVGQAYLFNAATGSLLQTFHDPTVTSGDRFGFSVAIDGNNVLIGAFFDDTNGTNVGQAHLFDATTGGLLQTFNDPTVTTADRFGWSVAIDGSNVLIGSYLDDTNGTNVGQAHLFSSISSTAIPEPSTLFLAALGLLSLGLYRWRRRWRA